MFILLLFKLLLMFILLLLLLFKLLLLIIKLSVVFPINSPGLKLLLLTPFLSKTFIASIFIAITPLIRTFLRFSCN